LIPSDGARGMVFILIRRREVLHRRETWIGSGNVLSRRLKARFLMVVKGAIR
jgi:hypothetical protein